jgi:hypothetical protein
MIDFVQEFADFPQGHTKDILDASAQCFQLLRTPTSEEEARAETEYEEEITQMRSPVTGY